MLTKTALVTGAASGLGFEFAKLLAAESYDLKLFDINEIKLFEARKIIEDQYHTRIDCFALDLSKPNMAEEVLCKLKGCPVDVLINNAGFGLFGGFDQTEWKHEESMIHLHVITMTHLTKLVLKEMLAKGNGRILNVASIAAFVAGPLMSIYYATKAYVLSFSQALSNELHGTGVTVTVLCPGQTKTGFQGSEADLSNAIPSSTKYLTSNPQMVAKYGYRAMKAGKRLAIPGLFNRFLVILPRILPRRICIALVRFAQENGRF